MLRHSLLLRLFSLPLLVCTLVCHLALAERINQEGRLLGPAPVVTNAVLFNTPEADAIVSAMQIFPVTSAWNEDISRRPLLPNSDAMIAQISADLASSRRTLRAFQEMNFVLVPDSQPLQPISLVDYPDESDPSPYPLPANLPIETWPSGTGGLGLQQWQQDINNTGGDRHAIIVQPGTGGLWEMWQTQLVGTNWQASNGAKFDLKSNTLRPAGWTSGDAAGLPMFPALPRYDECQRGMVEHACRLVVARTRKEYLYPATHYASTTAATQTNVPAMGQRLRLKASFVMPSSWAKEEKAILLALKKYGAVVADNGGFFSISVTPDDRWSASAFSHLSTVGITNFEVIQTTGPTAGPRSSGAPVTTAGADRAAAPGAACPLQGFVQFTGAAPAIQWKLYSGPGTVSFANAAQTNTTATFSQSGAYTLLLSADDSLHAVAYDAIVVTVSQSITLTVARTGTNLSLKWTGGSAPYVLEQSSTVVAPLWTPILTTNTQSVTLPLTQSSGLFRVRSQ
ncbi:MAG TPA: hypothetical protein VNT26_03915 [Candidatus Sulfotelmatobacter sp.]|nr:hypothetical protein [Candidatus Sulfotelmatobacter sp.]